MPICYILLSTFTPGFSVSDHFTPLDDVFQGYRDNVMLEIKVYSCSLYLMGAKRAVGKLQNNRINISNDLQIEL